MVSCALPAAAGDRWSVHVVSGRCNKDGKLVYLVRMTFQGNVYRQMCSYGGLLDLYNALPKRFCKRLPPMPVRSQVRICLSSTFREGRRAGLERVLQAALLRDPALSIRELRDFVGAGEAAPPLRAAEQVGAAAQAEHSAASPASANSVTMSTQSTCDSDGQ